MEHSDAPRNGDIPPSTTLQSLANAFETGASIPNGSEQSAKIGTKIYPVEAGTLLGEFIADPGTNQRLDEWKLKNQDIPSTDILQIAAEKLREGKYPVAFPTETVYGLGADATRSTAVQGIYKAKGRPSDNPLIVHICDLNMLQSLMPQDEAFKNTFSERYSELIDKFWPGPLTLIFPVLPNTFAPEVTAGLSTVGVRMPSSPLALTLIKLLGKPIAAPSANASTKPSPTAAEHVLQDLDGKIEVIVDGGNCEVGVESTIVDGFSDPPVMLRPGGISIDEIRQCKGWQNVSKAYKDASELGTAAPRAPGMKYKHYSPKGKVVLCESGKLPKLEDIVAMMPKSSPEGWDWPSVGIVRTKTWPSWVGWNISEWFRDGCEDTPLEVVGHESGSSSSNASNAGQESFVGSDMSLAAKESSPSPSKTRDESLVVKTAIFNHTENLGYPGLNLIEINLGTETKSIARGLFSALRVMDEFHADLIFVEGIKDEGDIAAAVMNRLRKAATEII
jgi:L-threonylcarbamoyladenylate synthase